MQVMETNKELQIKLAYIEKKSREDALACSIYEEKLRAQLKEQESWVTKAMYEDLKNDLISILTKEQIEFADGIYTPRLDYALGFFSMLMDKYTTPKKVL
jgi:hypothetical protein